LSCPDWRQGTWHFTSVSGAWKRHDAAIQERRVGISFHDIKHGVNEIHQCVGCRDSPFDKAVRDSIQHGGMLQVQQPFLDPPIGEAELVDPGLPFERGWISWSAKRELGRLAHHGACPPGGERIRNVHQDNDDKRVVIFYKLAYAPVK
jgi:hypothetical protein